MARKSTGNTVTHPSAGSFSLPQAPLHAASHNAVGALGSDQASARAARQLASTGAASPPVSVPRAIANAARATTVEFDYLVAQAQMESAMNPRARARTSSASGLYQFIESTWLDVMKRHGPRFGMSDIAAQISLTQSGHAYVKDHRARTAILQLRDEPEIASLMAAGLAEDNRSALMPVLGRQPEPGELYLAHFLGARGAGRFLSAMQTDPSQSAAGLFRRAAEANKAVFYESSGAPRSLAGVMDYLGAKLERALASAPPLPPEGPAGLTGVRAKGPVPYLITAEEAFEPRNPPLITGGARPISSAPLPALPTTPPIAPPTRRSLSSALDASLRVSGAAELSSSEGQRHIQRAYQRLQAMGL